MKNIPFGRPMIDDNEKNAVMDVLSGHLLVHGPKAKQFEENFANFTGAKYAIAVSSCTAAMHLAYFNWNLKPGDEVIVPAQTHIATAHVIELCGATPVFIDSEFKTGNIDIDQIESSITEHTRAIAVVHYLGMPVDMKRIRLIAQKYNLYILEDCALAIGSYLDSKHAGTYGDVGCFSFYPVKHLTTAEGGMLITNNEKIAQSIMRKRAFGVDRVVSERQIPGVYDVNMLGFNYRMNELQAALGIEQLKKINRFLAQRKINFDYIHKGLTDMDEIYVFQSSDKMFQSSYYCISALLDNSIVNKRYEIIQNLKKKGIGTSIYYPKPVPHMKFYMDKYKYNHEDYPVASQISNASIAFSVGPHLDTEDMKFIIENLKTIIMEIK